MDTAQAGNLKYELPLKDETPHFKELDSICEKILAFIINEGQWRSDEGLEFLSCRRRACQEFLSAFDPQKTIAQDRKDAAWNSLREFGLWGLGDEIYGAQLEDTRASVLTIKDLINAIASLIEYLWSSAEPGLMYKSNVKGCDGVPDHIVKGASANIGLLRFFIALDKRLGFLPCELLEMYHKLLGAGEHSFRRTTEKTGASVGVWAGIKAYLFLKERHPDFNLMPPRDIKEDVLHCVDLIGEQRDEETKKLKALRLYQIKGKKGAGSSIYNLSNESEKEKLLKMVEALPEEGRKKYLSDIGKIQRYADLRKRQETENGNPDCIVVPYWVETFSDLEIDKELLPG